MGWSTRYVAVVSVLAAVLVVVLAAAATGWYFMYTLLHPYTVPRYWFPPCVPAGGARVLLNSDSHTFEVERLQNCVVVRQYTLFQTCDSTFVPAGQGQCMASMVNLNPEAEYVCYSDERAFLFVRDRFPREVLHAYCALIPGAFRADLLRLCLLYEFGGLYTDVSNTALVNFWREIPAEAEYILVREIWPYHSGIHNAFMFVRNPKSSLVQQAIDDVVRNVRARQKGIMNVTGPIVLGQSVRKFMNLVPAADFPDSNPQKITFWQLHNDPGANGYVNQAGKLVVRRKYPNWQAERLAPHYSSFCALGLLYKNDNIKPQSAA